jgi:hypothetical protein
LAPNAVVVATLVLGVLATFGPHMIMLGYKVAGVRAPAALLYFCPLHRLSAANSSALVIRAKPLTTAR